MNSVQVVNLRGEKEPFSLKKVYRSARRAGADHQTAKKISQAIGDQVYSGMPTTEIYQKVKMLLNQASPSLGIKFSLRKGMEKLGPTGFPFEKMIRQVFKHQGFETRVNQSVPGHYIDWYEIDFLSINKAKKKVLVGECKYRSRPGDRLDLDVALSNFGRFYDIKNGPILTKYPQGYEVESILVTNAKFTSQAVKYSRGYGVELLGWRYPKDRGLETIIEEGQLWPITVLPAVNAELMRVFAAHKIMLVKDLVEIPLPDLAQTTGLSEKHLKEVVDQAQMVIKEP